MNGGIEFTSGRPMSGGVLGGLKATAVAMEVELATRSDGRAFGRLAAVTSKIDVFSAFA